MRNFTRTDVLETNIIQIFYLIILSSLFLLIGCNDEEMAEAPNGWVRVLPLELAFPASGGSQDVNLILTDDIDPANLQCRVAANGEEFKDFNTDIVTSIRNYDDLVYREQEFMGLVKYHKMFNNRMYFHIDYKGASPYSSAYRNIDALIKEIKARNYATPHARVHQITEENVQQYK